VITDPWFYAVAVPAVLLTGISKGGFGGGLGVLAVPLLSLQVPPLQAAAILLPILCLMDIFGAWAYRRSFSVRNLKILIPAGLTGVVIAGLTFQAVDVTATKLLIGLIAVGFSLHYWLGPRQHRPRGVNRLKGSFWGAMAGFTSFIAHAGGPPVSVYLLPQRLDKRLFVGTTVLFFITVNYAKLVPYAWLGQFPAGNLLTSLALAPLAPLGIRLGLWLRDRVSQVWFYRACYSFLLITGLKLLHDALPLWQG